MRGGQRSLRTPSVYLLKTRWWAPCIDETRLCMRCVSRYWIACILNRAFLKELKIFWDFLKFSSVEGREGGDKKFSASSLRPTVSEQSRGDWSSSSIYGHVCGWPLIFYRWFIKVLGFLYISATPARHLSLLSRTWPLISLMRAVKYFVINTCGLKYRWPINYQLAAGGGGTHTVALKLRLCSFFLFYILLHRRRRLLLLFRWWYIFIEPR